MIKKLYIYYMFGYSYLASKNERGLSVQLKEARIAANYTQQEVADYLGISRPTYISMEKNPERITIDEAHKLASMFGVDVNQIFFVSNCK